jgi:hypothetical protein
VAGDGQREVNRPAKVQNRHSPDSRSFGGQDRSLDRLGQRQILSAAPLAVEPAMARGYQALSSQLGAELKLLSIIMRDLVSRQGISGL